MSCNDERHKWHDSNCVADVIKFIDELQDSITENCPTGCETPFLGANCNAQLANTRPFALFTKKGELFIPASCFSIPTTTDVGLHVPLPSPFLRVESVDCHCAVLRSLVPDVASLSEADRDLLASSIVPALGTGDLIDVVSRLLICQYSNGVTRPGGDSVLQFCLKASQFCITVDLDCFCAVQCLRDAHVRGV
ncbi:MULTISPECIES: CotY/CotZ family spore coat protein [Bacillus cereus group]|uniref:Spore coat protein n=1 Tax=Bacillus cereus TaxID=1396 RepID=A0AA44QEX0_BACCE|nr:MULTISPECIES: CotY/CotZ family spore coat protein [Bacillus cereus group]EEL51724.1 Spore coat protein Z [Bacillus cereus Rock3-44]PFA14858.1 spore coat protein [Bacillus cereus]PFM99056.1 spore coat protein [Bacillus cereus]PFO76592.1 spore coat protein [Bacillus cereus]PFR31720.1 spore coat protein [Bacillus cereus]